MRKKPHKRRKPGPKPGTRIAPKTHQMLKALARGEEAVDVASQFQVCTSLIYILPKRYPRLLRRYKNEARAHKRPAKRASRG